jgi:excisionase family DNA binding protein
MEMKTKNTEPTMASATHLKNQPARQSEAVEPLSAHRPVREVMDIRQAADYLGISPDSLYKYASENFIPAFKLGNRWRFKRSLLESWMERQSSIRLVSMPEKSVKAKQKKPASRAR